MNSRHFLADVASIPAIAGVHCFLHHVELCHHNVVQLGDLIVPQEGDVCDSKDGRFTPTASLHSAV